MRTIFIAISLLLFFATLVEGKGLSDLVRINDLKIMSAPGEIRTVIKTSSRLSLPPDMTILKERLLQLDIEGSYTDPPKRSFTIDDPSLEKVDIYQLDKETVRIRLYLLSPFQEGGGTVRMNEEGFVVSLKREDGAAEIRDDTRGSIEGSFPSIFGGNEGSVGESEGSLKSDEESNPVVKVAASLALVLGIFLVGSYLYREKLFKKGALGKGNLIRVLDKGYIDVKKAITIVDVAGEILVLGTTGEKITMLTKLENEEALKRLKGAGKKGGKASFPHAVKVASGDKVASASGTLVDRVRSLKPLI